MLGKLKEDFIKVFESAEKVGTFFAPGRINVIGEHIDYNGGLVMPAAISYGTYAVVRKRDDRILRFSSLNFKEDGIISCDLEDLSYNKEDKWANFPKGILAKFAEKGHVIPTGLDVLFYGDIPNGAGLSSSASIEMVMGIIVKTLFDIEISTLEMVKLAQDVENNYIGVNTGIMDQFSVGFGKKNQVILLDCDTLDYEYAQVTLENHTIMIMHTNKERALSDSAYNERRAQCESALAALQTVVPIKHLCDLRPEKYESVKHVIKDETVERRARHAVYENARTKEAFKRLKAGDMEAFGVLLDESHASLKNDYEVTGRELDVLVEAAREQVGVLGARMTGAGFGGCAIALVAKETVESFKENVNRIYHDKIGYEASFYEATLSDGMREI